MLLRKGVYPYGFIDDWANFNKTSFPGKEQFYGNLNMENITDSDYNYVKEICNDFEIEKVREYHDLYLKSDTLLLVDVFGNFRKMGLEIYKLDKLSIYQLSIFQPRISLASIFIKIKLIVELIANNDMQIMVENGIRGGICL